ncbi:MAG: DoxX family protein [bacterium]
MNVAIILFSAFSFLFYGVGCFTSQHLKREFVRFGFSPQRRLIGLLQILGSLALIGGLWLPLLGTTGAVGVALMMLTGTLVRIKIRDSLLKTMPAVLYFLVNTYLALFAY